MDAAAATLTQVLAKNPQDFATHLALLDVYDALGDSAAFDGELERGLGSFVGKERVITLVRLIERLAAEHDTEHARELCVKLLEEPELAPEAFKVAERLFEQAGDVENLRRVLERRVESAGDSAERARALERLGEFFLEQLGNSEAAAECWRRGARSAKEHPDQQAIKLYERVLDCSATTSKPPNGWSSSMPTAGRWANVPRSTRCACVATAAT